MSTLYAQSVSLSWTASDGDAISHYNIYRSEHPDSSFQYLGSVDHPDTLYIDNGINSFRSYYYAATAVDEYGYESDFSNIYTLEPATATPVELSSFSARVEAHTVAVEWSTHSERNNYGFELQKSRDGQLFETVAFIHGGGTTSTPRSYRYSDDEVQSGRYYYRLKQIDLNGNVALSKIIEIALPLPDDLQLFPNYPNPFNPSTTISYTLPVDGDVELTVYNSTGQKITTLVEETQAAGYHSILWDGRDRADMPVPSGLYYYRIKTPAGAQFRKMLLLK